MRRFIVSTAVVALVVVGVHVGVLLYRSANSVIPSGSEPVVWHSGGTVISADFEDCRFTMTVDQDMRDYLWQDLSIERVEVVEIDCSRLVSRQRFKELVTVGGEVEVAFSRPIDLPIAAKAVASS